MNNEKRVQKAEERLKKHEKALAEKKKALESLKKNVKELSKAIEAERAEVEHIKMESLVELMNEHQVTFAEIEQAISNNMFANKTDENNDIVSENAIKEEEETANE
ncbi:MAG: hypothetical protein IK990_00310 [Ruminiclostridium sp.]|nr:hypothetical protein [Ruminiclostridium sp.]